MLWLAALPLALLIGFLGFFLWEKRRNRDQLQALWSEQQKEQTAQRQSFDQHQINSLKMIQEAMHQSAESLQSTVNGALHLQNEQINQTISQLSQHTQDKLHSLNQQVSTQLHHGFEKTSSTFNAITQRLTLIDAAQDKIKTLSNSVDTLTHILSDKTARGAYGEVQLNALIQDMIPLQHISLQHTLSNGKRVDCLLQLPEPTGAIAIDAKFPLETYQKMQSEALHASEKKALKQQFQQDIKRHIQAISTKYILPGETAEGAILFLPAESLFSEIHNHYPELIQYAYQHKVWITSPTTLMAVLTTAQAILKDQATQAQVHVIQDHLSALSKDFVRFQTRMDRLHKHIGQVSQDAEQVHKSAHKINSRFQKIEQVDLTEHTPEILADIEPEE
jgi:DNA recombination protein RmuC